MLVMPGCEEAGMAFILFTWTLEKVEHLYPFSYLPTPTPTPPGLHPETLLAVSIHWYFSTKKVFSA